MTSHVCWEEGCGERAAWILRHAVHDTVQSVACHAHLGSQAASVIERTVNPETSAKNQRRMRRAAVMVNLL